MEHIANIINNLIKWGTLAYIATKGFDALVLMRGTSTKIDLDLDFVISLLERDLTVRIVCVVAVVLMALSVRRERRLREQAVRKSERIREREHELDPNRSSSNLTPEGKTNPEDV